jgi:tetratricopeptide (TPR) repeat protein
MNQRLSPIAHLVLLCVLAPYLAGSVSADSEPEALLQRGVEALKQGRFEEAHQLLSQGLAEDRASGTPQEFELRFYLGLTFQQQAEVELDSKDRALKLSEAATQYERALEVDSKGGGALNNLAQIYADLGRDADARRLFERAVALEVPLLPFYHRNYGDFLASRGEWLRAAEHYRATLQEEPEDRQAHESLTAIYSQHLPDKIPNYLWFLIAQGQTIWAQEAAIERLKVSETQDESEAYLTLLVAALAGQARLPEELQSTQEGDVLTAAVLTTLSADPAVGEVAREVLRLHEADHLDDQASYKWWAERGRPAGNAEGELSPRQAFRHLIRSLGEAQRKTDRFESARQYFRLSVRLTREEPDLEAFRMMLSLPPETQDAAAIGRLAEWNEDVLREVRPEWGDLYLYRHDLGLLYSYLPDWQREGAASAVYQLEEAIQIEKNHPQEILSPAGPPDVPTFDARIWSRLAAEYSVERPEQARRILYDLVAAYDRYGLHDEADILLAMLQGGGRRPRAERQRDVLDDPPGILRDFTTEPPEPPQ